MSYLQEGLWVFKIYLVLSVTDLCWIKSGCASHHHQAVSPAGIPLSCWAPSLNPALGSCASHQVHNHSAQHKPFETIPSERCFLSFPVLQVADQTIRFSFEASSCSFGVLSAAMGTHLLPPPFSSTNIFFPFLLCHQGHAQPVTGPVKGEDETHCLIRECGLRTKQTLQSNTWPVPEVWLSLREEDSRTFTASEGLHQHEKKAFGKGLCEENTNRFNKHTTAMDFNTMKQSLLSAAVAGVAGCLLKNTD